MENQQLRLDLNEMRNYKFFFATPCYGGALTEPFFRSNIQLLTFFNKHQIPIAFGTIANESLVTRARNVLVAYFLQSDFTHLMFIDSDIQFTVDDVLRLYVHNKDVVVGAYPKKGVAWQRIRESVLAEGSKPLTDKDIAAYGSDYAINFKFIDREARTIGVENGLIKLHDAGTGFMMIKREAILKMIEAYPDLKYNNDVTISNANISDNFYALFDTMIDPVDRRYLSEDYTFCRRWQEIGGDIWLDPAISLNHYGHFCFQGNPNAIIQWDNMSKMVPDHTTTPETPAAPVAAAPEIKTFDLPDL